MKNIYLTISILLISILTIQAQFTVATHDGAPINDGDIFTFSELGTAADLSFDVTNTGSSVIDMRLEYVSMTNGDGSGTNLCVFGSCLPPGAIHVGDVFPSGGTNSFTQIDRHLIYELSNLLNPNKPINKFFVPLRVIKNILFNDLPYRFFGLFFKKYFLLFIKINKRRKKYNFAPFL